MTYNQVIQSAPTVRVEFYASWCPHCSRMMPVVEQLKELLKDSVPVYQFDIDKEKAKANEADIQSLPTFIIYRNGVQVWRQSGEMDGEALLARVQSF